MEIGGFFLLIVVIVVVAALGGGLYLVAGLLRHKQLDPDDDTVDGSSTDRRARPQHTQVESEQNVRFTGPR